MSASTTNGGRDGNGQFANGNPGGPGRPRRAIEADYMATISDCCPPAMWREIVQKTVEWARRGDPKARDWLARYLIGNKPPALLELAAAEHSGESAEAAIEREAARRKQSNMFDDILQG